MEIDTEEGTQPSVQTADGDRRTEVNIKYELIEAASKGDLTVFKRYEAHKNDPYLSDYDKRTPLHLAAVENHMEVVKYPIEDWKVDPNAKDRWGKTAYDEAVRTDNFVVANYLEAAQRTTRIKLDAQQYEIINAASEGNMCQLKRCHQEGLRMDFCDYDKRTPLHLAAAEGHADVVEFLINECKVDAEVTDRWGNTPRDEAERFNHRQLANLIQRLNDMEIDTEEGTEASVQTADGDRRTEVNIKYELIEAASKGDLTVFKRWGKTAYDEAVRTDNFVVANYLEAAQRTTRIKLDAQQYEIINAASEGNMCQLKRCHQEGLRMDFCDYDKRTPLHLAAAEGHADVVEFLINECKVDAEVTDRWGNTPRDEAERFNHRQLANLIQRLNEEQIYHRNRQIHESDKQDYERTLMNETAKSHCIRINIVGHSLAGKTSLAKRLLEQEFESTTKPTNSIDTHVYEVYATEEEGWKMLKEPGVYNDCYSKTIAFSEQEDTTLMSADHTKEKQREKPILKRHVKDIENFRLKKQARTDTESVPTFINIWDFGGQAVFHAFHQMFYSPDSIYLLVIDLFGGLVDASLPDTEFHKDVQENLNLKTIEELCIYWINTIFAYTGTEKRKPPIFLVGTHKDQMISPSDDEKAEKANKMFARIRKHFGEVIQDEIQRQTFFIDNTVSSDDETENLKKAILKYAKENTELEREIPKRWIPLEKSLRQIKDRNYASFQDILALNEQNYVPIDTDEELNDFLAYQHRQGSIVYFQDLKLSNHVILNPQWLIDAFKSVITDKVFFKGTKDDRVLLFEHAKIRPEAFEYIWRKDNTFYKRKDILLEFLKQFGVIARPKVETGDNLLKDEDFYYVPSLLTKTGDPDIESILLSDREKSIMKESIPLEFFMNTPILPPSQYNSIVSAIITKWPILQHNGEGQFFVNRCIVKLLDEKRGNPSSNFDTKPVITHYGSIRMPNIPGNVVEIKVYGIATYFSSEDRIMAEKNGSFVISSRKCDQFGRFVEKALRCCLER